MSNETAKDVIESLLFLAKKPLSPQDLHDVCGFEKENVEEALSSLVSEYSSRPMQIIKLANGYIMATRPQYSDYIDKFINSPVSVTLSHQALETLSIIAYRQPVTKLDIENIRGVMCDGVISTLLDKKLIKESGRADSVGRPILYSTTVDFLKHFGLHDLGELPKEGLFELEAEQNIHLNAQPL